MYFLSHAIQQQTVINRVKLLPKSTTDRLNFENRDGDSLTVIGNMHDYLVGGSDEDIPSSIHVKSWFTYVVYCGILKLDLPFFSYKLNIGIDLKTFYQDNAMPIIRLQKTLRFRDKGNLNLIFFDLSEVQYYPNIYATAYYFAQKDLDQPLIVLQLSNASFEGIYYQPGQTFTKQDYIIGSGFNSLNIQEDGKTDIQGQGNYLQQLVKKASKLFAHDENAPVYICRDTGIEDSILEGFKEKFIDKKIILINDHPTKITSIGLFLIDKGNTKAEKIPTVGIAFSKHHTFFTGLTKKSAEILVKYQIIDALL